MKKCKFTIKDNYTGETYETNSKRAYKEVITNLQKNYTKITYDDYNNTRTIEPNYTLQIREYYENGKDYTIATFY